VISMLQRTKERNLSNLKLIELLFSDKWVDGITLAKNNKSQTFGLLVSYLYTMLIITNKYLVT